jgi:hypothetical protein
MQIKGHYRIAAAHRSANWPMMPRCSSRYHGKKLIVTDNAVRAMYGWPGLVFKALLSKLQYNQAEPTFLQPFSKPKRPKTVVYLVPS